MEDIYKTVTLNVVVCSHSMIPLLANNYSTLELHYLCYYAHWHTVRVMIIIYCQQRRVELMCNNFMIAIMFKRRFKIPPYSCLLCWQTDYIGHQKLKEDKSQDEIMEQLI